MTVAFREAQREDLAAILGLLVDDFIGRGRESSDGVGAGHLAAFAAIEADPRNELIVVEVSGTVVGTMQLTYIPGISREGAERLQIEGVRVAAAMRGQGLGRKMMEWAIHRARERGCRLVQLTSDKARVDAHRFYDSLGFAASHEGFKLALE